MKKFLLSISFLLLALLPLEAQVDSTALRYAALDSLMTQFYEALEVEDLENKCSEMDFLIASCADSLARQHVALSIFDHYRDSRVMGEEAVAIYVYDKWFDSGVVRFQGEMDKLDADIWVKFNRNSQLGCDAPEITLKKPCGGSITLPSEGRTALMFFFDTMCTKCRLEMLVLPDILKDVDFPMNFYAVYVGMDKKSWRSFRRSFKLDNKNIKLIHAWDPEMESDYQMIYGVTGTPRVFLVEPQGTIIGRRLEMEALQELLPIAGAIQDTYDKYVVNQ